MRAVIFHHIEGKVKWWKDQLNTWYLKIKSTSKTSFQHSCCCADLFCYLNPLHTCYSVPFPEVTSNVPLAVLPLLLSVMEIPFLMHPIVTILGAMEENQEQVYMYMGLNQHECRKRDILAEEKWERQAFLFIGVWITRARKTSSSSHRAHKLLYRLVPVIRTVRLTKFPTAPLLQPK